MLNSNRLRFVIDDNALLILVVFFTPVVCRSLDVFVYVICVCLCPAHFVLCFCFALLRHVYPMVLISLLIIHF